MRRNLFVLICIFVGLLVFITIASLWNNKSDQHQIYFTVLESDAERMRGLSGRLFLPENEAVLFKFPEEGIYHFWMKDMFFAIDIIWLSSSGTIVHIERNVSPQTYPMTFTSTAPAQFVIECSAGCATLHNWNIGAVVFLPH